MLDGVGIGGACGEALDPVNDFSEYAHRFGSLLTPLTSPQPNPPTATGSEEHDLMRDDQGNTSRIERI